jgi:hypothetical protein
VEVLIKTVQFSIVLNRKPNESRPAFLEKGSTSVEPGPQDGLDIKG